jgi:hypothetical protein
VIPPTPLRISHRLDYSTSAAGRTGRHAVGNVAKGVGNTRCGSLSPFLRYHAGFKTLIWNPLSRMPTPKRPYRPDNIVDIEID